MTTTTPLGFPGVHTNQNLKTRLNWKITPVLVMFHVGAVAALFFFTWNALFVALFLYWVTVGLGLGICFHRLLVHRSFATPKWFEYFLTICAVAALEGGPLLWVANHRKHHQFADKEGDPHSPRDGKWWAHAGWILVGHALRQDISTLKRYVPDLAEDNFHVWVTKYHLVPTVILGLTLFLSVDCPLYCGAFFSAPSRDFIRRGSSTRSRIFGVRAALRPEIRQPTIGGWHC
jgi:fatty-acid desaturase